MYGAVELFAPNWYKRRRTRNGAHRAMVLADILREETSASSALSVAKLVTETKTAPTLRKYPTLAIYVPVRTMKL